MANRPLKAGEVREGGTAWNVSKNFDVTNLGKHLEQVANTCGWEVDLNASVAFDQGQFIISNADSFDWTNVKFEIKSGRVSSGYELKAALIKAGHSYTVGAMQFAKADGTRFNPFTTKAQKLSIFCDTPEGRGSYFGAWK
jgi:hypothetical protein